MILTTADSYLLGSATSAAADLTGGKTTPRRQRLTVIVLGLVALAMAFTSQRFLSVALYAYTHVAPEGEPEGAPAWRGLAVFRAQCIACHAMNGEGGKIGPDLNVPRSIVEYRPVDQLKAFIRNPAAFRYTSMPSQLHLSDAQLDALLDYFRFMSNRKRDPGPPVVH